MNTAQIEINSSSLKAVGQMMDNFKKDLWSLSSRYITRD
jgi:hypothetical protein